MDDSIFRVSMRYRLIVLYYLGSRTISKLPFENVLRASLQFLLLLLLLMLLYVIYLVRYRHSRFNRRKIFFSLRESLIHFVMLKEAQEFRILFNAYDVGR